MARRARLNLPGVTHHVIQRGNNKEYIFADAYARDYLVSLLRQAVQEDGAQIFAYVVMNNHFHLAMRSSEKSLGTVMHRINTTYGVFYNAQKARTGHVFQGRFKAIPILDNRYLLAVIRYIHRNPLAARLCDQLYEYRWSSDRNYRSLNPDFLDCGMLLDHLADDRKTGLEQYRELMGLEDEIDWEDFAWIDDDSVARVTEEAVAGAIRRRPHNAANAGLALRQSIEAQAELKAPDESQAKVQESLDEILLGTGAPPDDWEAIKSGSRLRRLLPFKMDFARAAFRQDYSMEQIAHHLNLTATAIYHYLK